MDKQTIDAILAALEDIRDRITRVENKIENMMTKDAHSLICASRSPTREAIEAINSHKERMSRMEKIVYGGCGAVLITLLGILISHIAK